MGKKTNFNHNDDVMISEIMNMTNVVERDRRLKELAIRLGREPRVLRNRFNNYIKTNKSEFTHEEDMKLIRLHKELGNKWKAFESHFIDRSSGQLSTRYRFLERNGIIVNDEQPAYDAMFTTPAPLAPVVQPTPDTVQPQNIEDFFSDDQAIDFFSADFIMDDNERVEF